MNKLLLTEFFKHDNINVYIYDNINVYSCLQNSYQDSLLNNTLHSIIHFQCTSLSVVTAYFAKLKDTLELLKTTKTKNKTKQKTTGI